MSIQKRRPGAAFALLRAALKQPSQTEALLSTRLRAALEQASQHQALSVTRAGVVAVLALCSAVPAFAVVVRGRVTDPLGKGIAGGRVQLVESGKVIAVATANPDGSYELRSGDAGRFTLLGSAGGYLPGIGHDFYGGATDVVAQDVVLSTSTVQQQVSVSATEIPTPLPQLTAPVTILPGSAFATRWGVVDELRQSMGTFVVQSGQTGGVTSLFVRGGNSTANLVLIDGMPAEDVGGTFDYGTVSATGIGRMEIYRGPDSAIYGTDAGAAVVTITTPRGTTLKPVLNYTGDAGNLHTYQNGVTAGGTLRKLDYFAGFDRQDTSNALPRDQYHNATAVANAGYNFNGNTTLRFTLRNKDSATGLPGAHDFFGLSADGKESDQDLYSTATLEHRTEANWHNLLRYGIARKREQARYFSDQGNPITYNFGTAEDPFLFTEYFGNVVTIRGANGYSATGQVAFLTGNDDLASNRDQLYLQSDWGPSRHFNGLFGFRYHNERGVFNQPPSALSGGAREVTQRTNFEYNLQFQGEFFSRLFYSLGGAVEKNHLYGIAGTPRFGLAFVPVRPGLRRLRGTRLRFNAATGVQEPTLALEYFSLYDQLVQNGDTAELAAYRVGPPAAERSRTYDAGVDQNILGDRLVLKAGYFHNVFDRQLEGLTSTAVSRYFGIPLPSYYFLPLYVNSLAYRAQGAEAELDWQARHRLLVRAGYTYLAARVLQSFASDALLANQGTPTENPNFPGVAIGAQSPLVGARPFRRPPNSGFFAVDYTQPRYSVALKGAFASRSDDSTYLDGLTPSFDNSLLLPNRDLDFGYLKLDLGASYQVQHNVSVFAQVNNLLNNQHIGPIGYPGLPLTVRAGLKVRLGGD